MRVAIYGRVSMEEQLEGHGIDAQLRVCREYAAAQGWDVEVEYVDGGLSARTDKRPEFRRMIADAQRGEFDACLVHKLDRFARNRADAVTYKTLLRNKDVYVYSATEPIDPTDPSSVILEGMLEVVAEWYSANLSQETAKGKRERVEKGYHNNRVPFGYQKEEGRDAVAEFHPDDIQGYRLAVKLALEGRTDTEIAHTLNAEGYRSLRYNKERVLFSKDMVREMLRSRFYLGKVRYKKEWRPGLHPAAVDLEIWERVQAVRKGRAVKADHANFATRAFPLTPVLYCNLCGSSVRGTTMRDTRYYRCTAKEHGLSCSQRGVRAEILEEQVGEFMSGMHIPGALQDRALMLLGQNTGEQEQAERKRRQFEGELERAKKLYIAGDLTDTEYQREKARVSVVLGSIVVPAALLDSTQALALLAGLGRLWDAANGQERKRLVCALLARALLEGKDLVEIQPKAGIDILRAA